MSISLQRLGYKDTLYNVVIDLPDVLEIDEKKMVVKVEPSVPIGRFSKGHFFKILFQVVQISDGSHRRRSLANGHIISRDCCCHGTNQVSMY